MNRHRLVVASAILVILSLGGASTANAGVLLPDPVYPCVQDPRGMKAADFNADGFLDLAVAGQNEPWSSVLIGRSDGSFESSRIPGTFSNDLAVGDFDGDGNIDIVESTGVDIDFHAGRGDGTFALPVPSGCATCEDYWYLEAADLNEDGSLDLVATTFSFAPYSNLIFTDFLLLGDGNGRFEDPTVLTEPGSIGSVGIADLDEDGHLDLVDLVPSRSAVCLHFGKGDGTFRHDPLLDCLPGVGGGWVGGTGDLDDDGNIDLALLQVNDQLIVMTGDGTGSFAPGVATPFDVRPYGDNLSDVNGDGILDVVGIRGTALMMLPGRGDGGFDSEQNVATANTGFGPIVFGDFDADGDNDVAAAGVSASSVQLIRGHRDGSLAPSLRRVVTLEETSANALATGDFDGDRNVDVAIADGLTPGRVTVLFGDGTGDFDGSTLLDAMDRPCTVTAEYVDADGTLDLVVGNCGSLDASVLLGNGDGSFANELSLPLGLEPRAIATSHFNGDPHTDLAVLGAAPDNVVRLFVGDGNGFFSWSAERDVGDEPVSLALADLDNNGTIDVVVANESSQDLSILLGDGSGGLAEESRMGVGAAPAEIVAADFDRDSRIDLALRFSAAQDGVAILLGQGAGTFSAPVPTPVSADVTWRPLRGLAVGDMDGDRYPDLLVARLGTATLLLGDGDGLFQTHGNFFATGRGPVLADLDGDLRLDVVLRGSSYLESLLNQGPTATAFEADKITLGWPPASDAVSYNVYRGELIDLIDANQDGLADDGYGVCVTSEDNDVKNNSFSDLALPSPSHGFFYLTSVVDSPGERDLGNASVGLAREPALPCP